MLVCAVPVAAVEYPGNSKITHEPLSSSRKLMFRVGASLSARISVPASTVVSPLTVNVLPLRLRTIGGAAAPLPPAPPRPAAAPGPAAGPAATPAAAPGPPRPAAAPGAGAAPLAAPPSPPRAPPPAVIPMRPKSPLHTAAFQSGLI